MREEVLVVKPVGTTVVCFWKSEAECSLRESVQILGRKLKTHRD